MQLEKHVFGNQNDNTRTIQMLLDALNSLRRCYVFARMNPSAVLSRRRESAKGMIGSGNGGSLGAGALDVTPGKRSRVARNNIAGVEGEGQQDDGTPLSWQTVYWVHVNYLTAAKAAQKCAAYFTSLLYVEHWYESQFGRLILGEPDFSDDDQIPLHEQLLLGVYTKINDPDGIRAVARTHKVASQLALFEHEGRWDKAMENYDLLLQASRSKRREALKGFRFCGGVATVEQPITGCGTRRFGTPGGCLLNEALDNVKQSKSAFERRDWGMQKGLLRSLQQMGCWHIEGMYSQGLFARVKEPDTDPEFAELQCEAAWRAGNWDLRLDMTRESDDMTLLSTRGDASLDFHAALHRCLGTLVQGDPSLFCSALQLARQGIVERIAQMSAESTQSVNPAIVKLQMLNGVTDAWAVRWPNFPLIHYISPPDGLGSQATPMRGIAGPGVAHQPSDSEMDLLELAWKERLDQMQGHYDLLEPLIALRGVLLRSLDREDRFLSHLQEAARIARKAGRLNHGANAVHEMKLIGKSIATGPGTAAAPESNIRKPQNSAVVDLIDGRVEEAKLLWTQGQHNMAVSLAKFLLHSAEKSPKNAALLSLTGKWLAETHSASSRVILDQYLAKAVQLVQEREVLDVGQPATGAGQNGLCLCRGHFRLARYADALYRQTESRLNSSEYLAALNLRNHKSAELEALTEQIRKAVKLDDKRALQMKAAELQKTLMLDDVEDRQLVDDCEEFLKTALQSYRMCLITGDKYDIRVVFRLICVWFNLSGQQQVNQEMLETIDKVMYFPIGHLLICDIHTKFT
ncbi:hypothetical protein CBR_g292 [Chara braunii]|uniref:FAT domain-containing protein n=1 Tax=Chara braunii TaxID=69332 RepID=A0A388JQI1_CHABU|nr:hypothetical protein CBR_g292 [Chara braunii]|eukprot:GBG59962.1 hypothetical protein CBR_g292 [Chara braunii]